MSKLRYFDASGQKKLPAVATANVHSEFLRTGHILRSKENWVSDERRYMTYEEVAARTGRKLQAAGEHAHEKINGFHHSIDLPKIVFHRTIESRPHLGYCHVTASKTKFAQFDEVRWAFYISNFASEIGDDDKIHASYNRRYSRMYFAVAMHPDEDKKKLAIDRKIRPNGVLFRTHDPKIALKNVLMLGTRSEKMRELIRNL